jgi:hypothetical protein
MLRIAGLVAGHMRKHLKKGVIPAAKRSSDGGQV